MAISFPSSPTTGDLYTYNSKTWQYNGEGWITYPYQNDGSIAYAASDFNHQRAIACRTENSIINGDICIAQEYGMDTDGAAAASGSEYRADQWRLIWAVSTSTISTKVYEFGAVGNPGYFGWTGYAATAACTFGSTDYAQIQQPLEGNRMTRYRFGTSEAKDIRVGFWCQATNTGTYCVSLRNDTNLRNYIREFTVSSSNTWEWHEVVFPGCTDGTWNIDEGQWGKLNFSGAVGSTYQGSANTWNTTNYIATSGAENPFQATNDLWLISGVVMVPADLEFPTDTSYNYLMMRTIEEEMQICQRYWQQSKLQVKTAGANYNSPFSLKSSITITNGAAIQVTCPFFVTMRATPTVTLYRNSTANRVDISNVGNAASAVDIFDTGFGAVQNDSGGSWTQPFYIKVGWIADARLA